MRHLLSAEQASAARDMVTIARMAAHWLDEIPVALRDTYRDGTKAPPALFVLGDLVDAAGRLEALIPALPIVSDLRASLALAGE